MNSDDSVGQKSGSTYGMTDELSPVTALGSEREVVEVPSDITDMWYRISDEVTEDIGEQYGDDEGTPLPVDLEVEVEMTVHDRDPEVDAQ